MNTIKLLILLLIAALFLPIPLSNTQAQFLLLHKLEAIFGHIVIANNVTLRMLPTPEMRVATMQFTEQNQPLIQTEEILLNINFLEWLLGGNAPISDLFIHKAAIKLTALLTALNEFNSFKDNKLPPIHIEHVSFDAIEEKNLALTIETNQDDTQLRFTQNTDNFIIKVTRAGKALLLDITANQWQLGSLDKSILTQISGTGRISSDQLELERFQANLGVGYIRGVLRFTHAHTWNTAGSLTLEQIPIHALLTWIGMPVLEGETTGTVFLDSSGDNASKLIQAASISGQLTVKAGTLHGIDLITPARNLTLGDSKGGETPFNSVEIDLERQNDELVITLANLHSNDINGNGIIRINEVLLLDGIMDMSLQHANKIPLLIAGTISEALVRVAATIPSLSKPMN